MHAENPENFAAQCSGPKIQPEVFRKSNGIFRIPVYPYYDSTAVDSKVWSYIYGCPYSVH
eukprot:COSAG01_NODE_15012_length_1385_cov_1.896579_2_plen_59_part_01